MGQFDPKKHRDGDSGGNRLDVAGDFVVAIRSFKRDKARSGKSFLLARHQCIYGPMKGKTFLQRYYLNDESLWKLGKACEAMGHDEAFDLDANRDVYDAICNKPFKVRIKIKRDGEKKYTDIDLFLMEWDDAEQAAADSWVAEQEAEAEANGHSGGYDDDGFGGGGGGGGDYRDPDDPGFNDEDLPF